MKIQCDVCGRGEASVFCCADEAALCESCDHSVHHANKLAGKHHRLSLSSQAHPLCDICKKGRGFVFCQEDRAILCRDCDAPIHTANELTMKHNRFLLTGARLSATPLSSPSPALQDELIPSSVEINSEAVISTVTNSPATSNGTSSSNCNGSSISEYLIKMLPGYQVDDFLDGSDELYKSDELMPFWEPEIAVTAKEFPVWAPHHVPQVPPVNSDLVGVNGLAQYNRDVGAKEVSKDRRDDSFMVPHIKASALSSSSSSRKRQRASSAWDF